MEKEIDLINRDPNNMNDYIQVSFEDVLAEPEGAHSADCVWSNSHKCFTCGLSCWYNFLTYCCGMCIALNWGCAFAEIAFAAIWFYTPAMRLLSIILHPTKKVMSIVLNTFLGPSMETVGLIFSRIHVVNSQGPAPRPLGDL